jgi:RTX calcium-binding nonapeptide repeat (4 copies)
LKSAVPGREPDERVRELKPWVRVVVTVWVLTAIPALLYLFATLAINAPLMYTTAWESFFVHYDEVRSALADGRVVEVIVGLLQIVLLIIPIAGVTLTFALFGKRLSRALWSWLRGKPPLRAGSASALLLGREGRLKKALERAEEDYESLVRTTASLGTMLAEEIQKRGDLGEFGRRRRDLSLLTRQADLRRTELRHELLTLRAKRAEDDYRRAAEEAGKATRALEGARKAFVEADGAARRSGLEARRLAEQRDKEARHLEELRPTAEKRQEERAVSHAAPKESGLERSLGNIGESSGKERSKVFVTAVVLTLAVVFLFALGAVVGALYYGGPGVQTSRAKPPHPSPPSEIGTNGPDTLRGANRGDNLFGRGGNDVLFGLGGRNNLVGGPGNDAVISGRGSDTGLGDAGNDYLQDGNLRESSEDTLSGGPGNDLIVADNVPAFEDLVVCGPGFDWVLADTRDVVTPADCEKVRIVQGSREEVLRQEEAFFASIPRSFAEGLPPEPQ